MKLNREMKVALFFICFAIFYLVMAGRIASLDLFSSAGMNSKTLPRIYGILMIILGAVLFLSSWAKQRKLEKSVASESDKKSVTMLVLFGCELPRGLVYLAVSVLLFAFYAATYTWLGFLISGFLYLGLMIMLLTPADRRSVKMTIATWVFSFAFVFVLYELFTRVLSMMLPRGILG